jgi:fructose-bisphosphate aldolase, class I
VVVLSSLTLPEIAAAMVADHKGLLAMDESNGTCNQRFAEAGIPQTFEARRAYRELLLTTPGLHDHISGVILYDETIRQHDADGRSFVDLAAEAGLILGIKVDTGAKSLAGVPGEKVTEGLDGLRGRLEEYAGMGARFAKWRGVIAIGDTDTTIPSQGCLEANAHALARYAALCQEAGLVPVVEADVLMNGTHTLARCAEVTEAVLHAVFTHLRLQRVSLEGIILKPNMVLPGLQCPAESAVTDVADVADATVRTLLRVVPAAVPGVVFLSGGQSGEQASARLNAMHVRFGAPDGGPPTLPWALTFSFARAIQRPALHLWAGQEKNRVAAQQALLHRTRCNQAALLGEYTAEMEMEMEMEMEIERGNAQEQAAS